MGSQARDDKYTVLQNAITICSDRTEQLRTKEQINISWVASNNISYPVLLSSQITTLL